MREDEALEQRIHRKFGIKNTTGYSLNALVDFEDPFEILQHLMVGSEDTLGFISEVAYRTVPEHPYKASAPVFFPNVETACRAVTILKSMPVDAVEIMDRPALRSVEDKPGMPPALRELPAAAAALLIEARAETAPGLMENTRRIGGAVEPEDTLNSTDFTDVPEEFAKLWKIRKGLFPSVGAVRAAGTAVVIEDVAFPVPKLAAATLDLQALFAEFGYHNAIIFGHALEGNLHFVITPDFNDPAQVENYKGFMAALSKLVVERYDGSLKAEHSTGRNMAPFVVLEWGSKAYELMREIKALLDPNDLLNPGVILNGDPLVHVKNLKPMPPADERVDRCIECGFCEPICPSRNMSGATAISRLVLGAVSTLSRPTSPGILEKTASGLHRLTGNRIPIWDRWMPRSASRLKVPAPVAAAADRVVYLPSCASRVIGTAVCDEEQRDLQQVTLSLLTKAGFRVVVTDGFDGLCCGMPFASKGLKGPAQTALERTEEALWKASERGSLPVLCDTSPCTARMIEGFTRLIRAQEPVGFALEHLLPHLRLARKADSVALHVTRSARKMGLDANFLALAETCTAQVFQAQEQVCCSFADEKGLTVPELNAAALDRLRQQIPEGCDSGYSNSRTCEIGLSRHSGIPYRSILYLIDACFEARRP